MSIADLRAKASRELADTVVADGAFQRRVNVQQFLNDLSPVLSALARANEQAPVGLDLLKEVDDLALRIAGRLSPADQSVDLPARLYRGLAARVVSDAMDRCLSGEAFESYLSHVLDMVARNEGRETSHERYPEFSPSTSLALTAASVAGRLSSAVIVYSFRQDPSAVLMRLTNAVLDAALAWADEMKSADEYVNRSLLQTLSNRATDIMAAVYERSVHETALALRGKPEDHVVGELARADRVDAVLASFDQWVKYWTSAANSYWSGTLQATAPAAAPSP